MLLRRTLKRQLDLAAQGDSLAVPDMVRSEAVGLWRQRYLSHLSKAARRRKGYTQLRHEPTYQALERQLAKRYWQRHLPANNTSQRALTHMPLDEACALYQAASPRLNGTPLDSFLRECLEAACEDELATGALHADVKAQLIEAARTQNLSSCAHVYQSDPTRPSRHRRRPFSLDGVTSPEEAAQLVQTSHLVEGMMVQMRRQRSTRDVIGDLLVRTLQSRDDIKALFALLTRLLGSDGHLQVALERCAQAHTRTIAVSFSSFAFSLEIARALIENPHYRPQYQRAVELKLRVRENVPETPMEAYPLARTMRRHFVVHVGPTNAGKTHSALEDLMQAASGAYLAPLRLLAFEQFDRMNKQGVPCTLLTGEEQIDIAGARHVASTVEMANYRQPIEVAVIDEAQMVADHDRGHSWTSAILGIPAQRVHICCAPHAERVVCRLIALCGDECEMVRHERLVPLRLDRRSCRIPNGVEPGDALIVFSRRAVHAVAADVAAAGLKPSLIYGALPHDVRHEEARRFDQGETDVVVATDAIGMGMNLPIRRIVFVEQEKYDGHALRPLLPHEVQQIAGRAGRFGRYDEGLYQSTRRRKQIAELYGRPVADIEEIPVGIPDNIALVRDASLGDSIRQWASIEQPAPFRRMEVSRELGLLSELEAQLPEEERIQTDTKLRELTLITMPFDERDRRLKEAWRAMAEAVLSGRTIELPLAPSPATRTSLGDLESDYHYCDLLYDYERAFGSPQRRELLTLRRTQISRAIMDILASGTTDEDVTKAAHESGVRGMSSQNYEESQNSLCTDGGPLG